ncbi:hypothetical protein [Pontibacter sp. G13]|uniref:hypothetical protein n=1 Tax=Pontibacter sp. G13 TaxID=3074898 RepID=UPI002889045E|nr:hypothetical protein [Pontibacter sp. G13]WNJ19167.1 hypothetical protein RJD25_01635 [Pontibacter sp. G13]
MGISFETWFGILMGFGLSLLSTLIIYLISKRNNDPKISIREFSRSESNDEDFYRQFLKAIKKSRKEVIQYAEGFHTGMSQRYDVAQSLINDIRDVLQAKPHIHWLRYQTSRPHDQGWMEMLGQLKTSFPKQFNLLMVDNKLGDHIMSVVLIDPGTRYSKTFLLVANPTQMGAGEKVNLANASLMISGSKEYSKALRYQIELMYDRLKQPAVIQGVSSPNGWKDLPLSGKVLKEEIANGKLMETINRLYAYIDHQEGTLEKPLYDETMNILAINKKRLTETEGDKLRGMINGHTEIENDITYSILRLVDYLVDHAVISAGGK